MRRVDVDDEDRAGVPTHPGATPRFAAPSLPPSAAPPRSASWGATPSAATPPTTGRLGPSRSARNRFGASATPSAPSGPAPLDAGGPIGLKPRRRGDDLDLDEPETVLEDRAGKLRRIGPKRDEQDDPATVVARASSDPLRLGLGRGASTSGLRTPAPSPRAQSRGDRSDRSDRDRDRDRSPATAGNGRGRASKPPPPSDDPETVQLSRSRMRMSFIGGSVMDPATVQDHRIASELWRHENGGVDEVPPGRLPSASHDRSNTTLSRFEIEPSEPGDRATVSSRVFVPLIVGGLGGGVLVLILLALVAGTLAM